LLQGDRATVSIKNQLKRIKKVREHFDVVAIIRGGGGDIGLSCYNNYELAREIALFPIPVITGIGHVTNETVVEMISFSNAITPTKIAEYLLQKFHNFSVPVQKAEEKIRDKSRRLLSDEKAKFGSEIKLFRSVTENILIGNRNQIKENINSLVQQTTFRFKNEKEYLRAGREEIKRETLKICTAEKLEINGFALTMKKDVISQIIQSKTALNNMEKNIENMSPESVLKRGYSITLSNGKAVKSTENLKEGDALETILFEGRIFSLLRSTKNTQE
jgi:exodeoxyribonuclease VII large subunit